MPQGRSRLKVRNVGHTLRQRLEYKVLEVRVRQLPSVKLPNDLGPQLDEATREGWEIDHVVPVMAKGLLGGSYTDSLLVFLKRHEDRVRMPN